jgi:hypothetical protein
MSWIPFFNQLSTLKIKGQYSKKVSMPDPKFCMVPTWYICYRAQNSNPLKLWDIQIIHQTGNLEGKEFVLAPIKRLLSTKNTPPSQKSVFFCRDIIQRRDQPLFVACARDFRSYRCGSLNDLLPSKLSCIFLVTGIQ